MYTRIEAGVGAAGKAAEQGDRKYELLLGSVDNGAHLLFLDKNICQKFCFVHTFPEG